MAEQAKGAESARRQYAVQRRGVMIEAGLDLAHARAMRVAFILRSRPRYHVPSAAQILQHEALLSLGGMKFQGHRSEPGLAQAALHHFERRHLFGDEQDFFALQRRAGDDVGDGLALAGARRALDDEMAPAYRLLDRHGLARNRHLRYGSAPEAE